jgi:hypothetical protein
VIHPDAPWAPIVVSPAPRRPRRSPWTASDYYRATEVRRYEEFQIELGTDAIVNNMRRMQHRLDELQTAVEDDVERVTHDLNELTDDFNRLELPE